MLLRSVQNHSDAVVAFQTVKAGQRLSGIPDHSFFTRPVPSGKFLIDKETVGYGTDLDCSLQVFPTDETVRVTRPLFIFREPRATYVSWLENNLVPEKNPRLFIQAYRHVFFLALQAASLSSDSTITTYEQLCDEPERVLRALCKKWRIDFQQSMIDWKDDFDTTPLDAAGVRAGHYAAVARGTTFH